MSVAQDTAEKEERQQKSPAFDAVYAFLSSVRFTIFILCLIAVACVIGTLIPQQAPAEEYRVYSESTYLILRFLGLTDVFHAFWFLGLAGLFVFNLILCTVQRFTAFLKTGPHKLPSEKTLSAMPLKFVLKGKKIDEVEGLFRGYRSRREERGAVLEKGSISRYGVYIVHTSIIVILLGSLIGLLWGYRGSVTLAKGEAKSAAAGRDSRTPIPLGFAIKLDNFNVSFYPNGEPKEYVSRVEIIDAGKVVKKADVRVNHPLSYHGTSIYQASYGSDPVILFDVGGQEVRIGQGAAYRKGDLTLMVVRAEKSIHNFGPGVMVAYMENGQTKTTWFLKDAPGYAEKDILGVPVRLKAMSDEYYTGLEVASDPGVWVVWTGFALILFGLYINFFMYQRRIYLLETPEGVLVAGMSARNKETFREEFEKWREKAYDVER